WARAEPRGPRGAARRALSAGWRRARGGVDRGSPGLVGTGFLISHAPLRSHHLHPPGSEPTATAPFIARALGPGRRVLLTLVGFAPLPSPSPAAPIRLGRDAAPHGAQDHP